MAHAEFKELYGRVTDSLAAVGRFLVQLLEAPQGDHRPVQLLALDAELQKFWKTYDGLKQRHSQQSLQVAVLALTKSGTRFVPLSVESPSACPTACETLLENLERSQSE